MIRTKCALASVFVFAGSLFGFGCLDPLVSDDLDPNRIFGDGNIPFEEIPHVEADEAHAERAAFFVGETAYLRGYADGRRVWYWNIGGPNTDFIVPMYILVDAEGNETGRWIFDALPGDGGYSPWWRKFKVRTTASYAGEKIWSRAAIDLGVRQGILESPEETTEVYNFPIVSRFTRTAIQDGLTVGTSTAWYRNQRVSFVEFTEVKQVPLGTTEFPKYPVYLLQRINEASFIYEFATGVDIDGDGRLINSNNIFAGDVDSSRYSPLWYVAVARVPGDYVSVETSTAVELDRESDLWLDEARSRPADGITIQLMRSALVNCPIQRTKGSL